MIIVRMNPKYSERFKRRVLEEIQNSKISIEGARRKYGIGGIMNYSRISFLARLILFLNAYIPLGIIFLILDFEKLEFPFFKNPVFSTFILALTLILPLLFLWFISYFRKKPTDWHKIKITKVQNMDSEILSYIFTYILPFLGFPVDRQFAVAIFMLLIVGILYTRSDMVCINPILALLGYHIVKIEWEKNNSDTPDEIILISRKDYYFLKYAGSIDAIQIQKTLYLLKEEKNAKPENN